MHKRRIKNRLVHQRTSAGRKSSARLRRIRHIHCLQSRRRPVFTQIADFVSAKIPCTTNWDSYQLLLSLIPLINTYRSGKNSIIKELSRKSCLTDQHISLPFLKSRWVGMKNANLCVCTCKSQNRGALFGSRPFSIKYCTMRRTFKGATSSWHKTTISFVEATDRAFTGCKCIIRARSASTKAKSSDCFNRAVVYLTHEKTRRGLHPPRFTR